MTIRLVTFDALHTLIAFRAPVQNQYADAFLPFFGKLDPNLVKSSFKSAWNKLQSKHPAYAHPNGPDAWWSSLIQHTALGLGLPPDLVRQSLPALVPSLLDRFSSKQAYVFFQDSYPVLRRLHEMKIHVAVVSNADSRIRSVFKDLEESEHTPILSNAVIVLSDEERIQKPDGRVFHRALERVNIKYETDIKPEECVHVGDEFDADYRGALAARMNALLLTRPDQVNQRAHLSQLEHDESIQTITRLHQVLDYIQERHH